MTEWTYRFRLWVGVTGVHVLVLALRIIIAIYSNSWTMFVVASVGGEAEEVEMKDWRWLGLGVSEVAACLFWQGGESWASEASDSLVLLPHRHSIGLGQCKQDRLHVRERVLAVYSPPGSSWSFSRPKYDLSCARTAARTSDLVIC